MTDQEINEAIGRAIGSYQHQFNEKRQCELCYMFEHEDPHNECPLGGHKSYTTDLNAMHEAKMTLNEEQREKYLGFFIQQQIEEAFSSARLQAEAVVRALGKWRDE